MNRQSSERRITPRRIAAVASILGVFAVGPWAAYDQYQQAMKDARSAAPRLELYDPNYAEHHGINTRSLPGMAIAAYLNGLPSEQTSEKAVSNHGKNLRTTIALPDGSLAILGVESSRAHRTIKGNLVPSADDAVKVTIGKDGTDGSRRLITFTRLGDNHANRWSVSEMDENPGSDIERTKVISPNSIGIIDMVTTYDMLHGTMLDKPRVSHDPNAATDGYNRAAYIAAGFAAAAFNATVEPRVTVIY